MPSMTSWPTISVIVPSFNQGKYIERTLKSILKQRYEGEVQIVVSDGGSSDETVEVLRRYPQITWWSEPDRGFTDAVTKGLARAAGEVVAIQSSDDFYLEDAFQKAIPVLLKNPEYGLVTGADAAISGEDDKIVRAADPVERELISPWAVFDQPGIPQHCTFLRRTAIDQVGGLREKADQCADVDLWYRILHFWKGRALPEFLGIFQLHEGQRTQKHAEKWIAALRYMIDSCETDSRYSAVFKPDPQVKAHVLKANELTWYRIAGGESEQVKRLEILREILASPSQWPSTMVDEARQELHGKPFTDRLADSLKGNPLLRRVFRKPPPVKCQGRQADVNIDWWRSSIPED